MAILWDYWKPEPMRVLLLNPPISYYTRINLRLNPTLALAYISAMLKNAGHKCAIVDMEALEMNPQSMKEILDRFTNPPDVIGVTVLTSSAKGAKETIQATRGYGYTGRIVVGGVHATMFPEEVASWPGVDTVVTGECEGNVVSIFEDGRKGIVAGEALPITSLPLPDWSTHIPSFDRYHGNPPFLLHPEAIAMMSRGCPHRCLMCSNPLFKGRRQQFRTPESIALEVQTLKEKFGVKSVFFYDDELPGSRLPEGWLDGLVKALGPLGVVWKCQGRCSRKYVTPDVMRKFYEAGCRAIMWGVESFSQKVLDYMKKDVKVEEIMPTLRASKEAGILNWAFTMIGNYGETEEDVLLTLRGLEQAYKEGLIDFRQTTVVTALPATELEKKQKEEGWYHEPPNSGPLMYQTYHSTPWLPSNKINYYLAMFERVCPGNVASRKFALQREKQK